MLIPQEVDSESKEATYLTRDSYKGRIPYVSLTMNKYSEIKNNALHTEMSVTVVPLHVSPEPTYRETVIPCASNRIHAIVLSD
jgi:hypothetical protein